MGEQQNQQLELSCNTSLMVAFQGSQVTSHCRRGQRCRRDRRGKGWFQVFPVPGRDSTGRTGGTGGLYGKQCGYNEYSYNFRNQELKKGILV